MNLLQIISGNTSGSLPKSPCSFTGATAEEGPAPDSLVVLPLSFLHRRQIQAYTLLELLVVVTVTAIMAALSLPAISGLLGSRTVDSGGNQIVDLVTQARQNSMSKQVMTALVLVTNSSISTWNNRLLILLQLTPGSTTWTPVSKWYFLPQGIEVNGSNSSFITQQEPTLPQSLGALSYLGTTISPSAYAYQVFTPEGQILVNGIPSASPPELRLVNISGEGSNYYDVTINLYTGTPTIDRP